MEYTVTVYETDKFIARHHEPVRTPEEQQRHNAAALESCRAYIKAVEREIPGYFSRKEAIAG